MKTYDLLLNAQIAQENFKAQLSSIFCQKYEHINQYAFILLINTGMSDIPFLYEHLIDERNVFP